MITTPKIINVAEHIFGYFSKNLQKKEITHFLDVLEQFRLEKIGIKCLRNILISMSYRFEDEYILRQTFLHPYPKEL